MLRPADGGYDEVAVVAGDDAYETTEPFAVRVVPADIVRPPAGSWARAAWPYENGADSAQRAP
ncbi:MAG TPA: hypothetical protein VFP61_13550 [Acidimicrobiales bacterium]|nr:hypothetical protein [Acidimicrobiales bacterium]